MAQYRLQLSRTPIVLLCSTDTRVTCVANDWPDIKGRIGNVFLGLMRATFSDGVHTLGHCSCIPGSQSILSLDDISTEHMVFEPEDIFDCFHLQALRLSIETLWQSATTVQPQPIIECQFDSKMCAAVEMEGHWGLVHLDGKIENRRPKCCLTCRRNGCGHTQSYNKSIGLFDHIDFSGDAKDDGNDFPELEAAEDEQSLEDHDSEVEDDEDDDPVEVKDIGGMCVSYNGQIPVTDSPESIAKAFELQRRLLTEEKVLCFDFFMRLYLSLGHIFTPPLYKSGLFSRREDRGFL